LPEAKSVKRRVYQKRILPGDVVDCPRLPAAQPFDVGVVLGAEE
jgi:hypothetical protein